MVVLEQQRKNEIIVWCGLRFEIDFRTQIRSFRRDMAGVDIHRPPGHN